MHNIVIHTALACFASISLIVLLRNTALRMGLVDYPGGRKQHEGGVPLVGGIAIYGAFAFSALLITQTQPLYPFRSLLGGMGVLVLAGALDDMHDLSPLAKLGMQCGAALLMVSWGGVFVPQLGDLFGVGGVFALGNFAVPFTLVCVLGVINALNMTDGVDGLAGGLALVSLLAFAAALRGAEPRFAAADHFNPDRRGRRLPVLQLSQSAASARRRIPRRRRQHGAGLRVVLVRGEPGQGAQCGRSTDRHGVAVGRPVARHGGGHPAPLLSGRSPLSADRGHLHHLLLRAGLSDTATTLTLLLVAVISAIVGLAIWRYRVPAAWGFYGFMLLIAATVIATRIAIRHFAEVNSQPTPDDNACVDSPSGTAAQAGSVLTAVTASRARAGKGRRAALARGAAWRG